MNKVAKSILGLLMVSPTFAQTSDTLPNLGENLIQLQKSLDELSQQIAGKTGKVSFFIRTEEDKLIRFQAAYPNTLGTELNAKITKTLLSTGKYESENELVPELGIKCQKTIMKLSKNNKIAIAYGVGCQRGS